MNIVSHGISDPGARRKVNDDYQLVDPALGLHIVCDGVSGGQHGVGEAARLCAETVRKALAEMRTVIERCRSAPNQELLAELESVLRRSIESASGAILGLGTSDPKMRGLSTTIEAALVIGNQALLAHVGDSRTYLIRDNEIHQVTEDHTMAAEMRKQGEWSEEDARKSAYASTLTRAVGTHASVQVDLLRIELSPGDQLLLCTDGLHSQVKDTELLEYSRKLSPKESPAQLVELVKKRDGYDNVSVVATGVEGDPAHADSVDALSKRETLRKVALFRHLSYPELIKLLRLVRVRKFSEGETVIQEGAMGDDLFVIVSGELDVIRAGASVATRASGDFLGEIGFFNNVSRTATVKAKTPVSALAISRKELLLLLKRESGIAVKLLWSMGQELSKRSDQLLKQVPDSASLATDAEM